MLRSFFISLSKATWAQKLITRWKFAWKAASRFVAGNTSDEAILAVRELNNKGCNATLDHLGESTATRNDANKSADDVIDLLKKINISGVRANVSIKLTQIGLAIDEHLCEENLERILKCALQERNFIRIDIEDTPYTDKTYQLFMRMQEKGYKNTGIAVQSYLFRAENDTRDLLRKGACFRFVKGAYKEPPEVAFPKKLNVDANFDLLAQIMMDGAKAAGSPRVSTDGRIPPIPAIGTHDPKRLAFAKKYASDIDLPKTALEFQMLYGIRRDLQDQCVTEEYPVRIYVPYGTHWYPYFMRRLAERPANFWFFVTNFFKR